MDRRSLHAPRPLPAPTAAPAPAPRARRLAGGARARRRPWGWWALSLLLVLACVGGAWGLSWAKAEAERRVRAALQAQGDKIGWAVEVEAVAFDWTGEVTLTGVRATAPTGGTVHIQTLRATIPPSQWWDGPRRPDLIALHGVRAALTLDEARDARQRLRQRPPRDPSAPAQPMPTVHVLDLDARLLGDAPWEARGLTLPRRLTARSLVLSRGDGGWALALDAAAYADDGQRLPLTAHGTLSAQSVRAAVRFPQSPAALDAGRAGSCSAASLEVEAQWDGPLSLASLTAVSARGQSLRCDLAGVGAATLGALHAARLSARPDADGAAADATTADATTTADAPPTWQVRALDLAALPAARFGVERLTIEALEAAFTLPPDARPRLASPLTLRRPDARLDLAALVRGPLLDASPAAARVIAEGMTRLGWVAPTLPAAPAAADAAAPAAPASASAPPAASPATSRLSAALAALPPVRVEDGSVSVGVVARAQGEQPDTPQTWRLSGLDFGLGEGSAAGQRLEVSFRVRGASACLVIDAPRRAASWPRVALTLQDVPLLDLLQVAGLPTPAALQGRADLDLTFDRDDLTRDLTLQGSARVRGGGFHHPKVSAQPLTGIELSARGRLRYSPLDDSLRLDDAEVGSGPLVISVEALITQLQSDPLLSFRLWRDRVPCDALPAALPRGALDSIERVVMSGHHMSPKVDGSLRVQDPMTFTLKVDGIPGDCAVAALPPYDVQALNDPKFTFTTPYTSLPEGIRVGPGMGAKMFTPLAALPSYLPAAMFLTEDVRFFDHGGLRLEQFVRAVRLNLTEGRYVYGGSSLTQQLVKNLLLHRRKTLSRKLEEALLAWHLEDYVPKERILELYINCIEFGPDIYGVTRAAAFYFDKRPHDLSPLEAAFLASLKVAPRYGGDFYEHGFPSDKRWWAKRPKEILLSLSRGGYISPAELLAAHPFLPAFTYPDPAASQDFRNQWLARRKLTRKSARNP